MEKKIKEEDFTTLEEMNTRLYELDEGQYISHEFREMETRYVLYYWVKR